MGLLLGLGLTATAATVAAAQAGHECQGATATIVGTEDDDDLDGTSGDDVVVLLGGNDTFDGQGGNDIICGDAGADEIDGGTGDDVIDGGEGDDVIDGEDGSDTLIGGSGEDAIDGGDGDDNIRGGDNDDELDGQDDNDIVFGDQGDDRVDGGSQDDELHGGAGVDDLRGNSGADQLYGGPGIDDLSGGTGSDWCSDLMDDLFSCETESDDSDPTLGEPPSTTTTEAPQTTTSTTNSTTASTTTSAAPSTTTTTEPAVESSICDGLTATIVGTAGGDVLTGTDGDDIIVGLGGRDVINGLGGDDIICGGPGGDSIDGGPGADQLDGGSGNDAVYGQDGDDTVYGGTGSDQVTGDNGDDYVDGGPGSDTITGGLGVDTLVGDPSEDTINAGDQTPQTTTTTAPPPAPTTTTSSPPAPTTTTTPAPPASTSSKRFNAGDRLLSTAGTYEMRMQGDGNLVVYRIAGNYPLWSSRTDGHPGAYAVMQGDGNLVVVASNGSPLWDSGTWQGAATLTMQGDGNLVIYRNGSPVWASNTVDTSASPGGNPDITISQGSAYAPGNYWYVVALSNFNPGSRITLYCHDSADSNFHVETVTVNSSGSYSDSTLCHSPDGPDHWVTGGGAGSNNITWGSRPNPGDDGSGVDPGDNPAPEPTTSYGTPLNSPHGWGNCTVQDFQHPDFGWIVVSTAPAGPYVVRNGMLNGWLEQGHGADGALACPTSDEYSWNGWIRQDFQGGPLLWKQGWSIGRLASDYTWANVAPTSCGRAKYIESVAVERAGVTKFKRIPIVPGPEGDLEWHHDGNVIEAATNAIYSDLLGCLASWGIPLDPTERTSVYQQIECHVYISRVNSSWAPDYGIDTNREPASWPNYLQNGCLNSQPVRVER